jgi:hypothetical protein
VTLATRAPAASADTSLYCIVYLLSTLVLKQKVGMMVDSCGSGLKLMTRYEKFDYQDDFGLLHIVFTS